MRTSNFDLVKLDGILKRDFFVALATGRFKIPTCVACFSLPDQATCAAEGLLSQLHAHLLFQDLPCPALQVIDLIICETALHAAVRNAVAVAGAFLQGQCYCLSYEPCAQTLW